MIPITPASASIALETSGSHDLQHCMRPGTLQLTVLPPLSLYVHLPWCLKKCPYCDFNSHEMRVAKLPEQRYIDALMADLEAALPLVWGPYRSQYFYRRRHAQPVFTPGHRSPAGQHSGPSAAGARLRDHAGSQSGHIRKRPFQGLQIGGGHPPVGGSAELQR